MKDEIVCTYRTRSGKEALIVRKFSKDDGSDAKFSFIGIWGAGSGFSLSDMKPKLDVFEKSKRGWTKTGSLEPSLLSVVDDEPKVDEPHKVSQTKPVSLSIPLSRYREFRKQYIQQNGLRFGQAFYNYMELHKVTSEKEFCDTLFNASDVIAVSMIEGIVDYRN
jgi:hypothetical protein